MEERGKNKKRKVEAKRDFGTKQMGVNCEL